MTQEENFPDLQHRFYTGTVPVHTTTTVLFETDLSNGADNREMLIYIEKNVKVRKNCSIKMNTNLECPVGIIII
jgi:hypothetical protein